MNPSGASDAAAALKGASLAFQNKKKPPPPTTPSRIGSSNNGALTAASQSASRSRSPAKGLDTQWTGGSAITDATHGMDTPNTGLRAGNTGNGGGGPRIDPKSPSFIAATLAASRNATPSPGPGRMLGRQSSIEGTSATSSGSDAVDSLPIAPTNSLISMFERAREGDPVKKVSPRRLPAASSDESLGHHPITPVKLHGLGSTKPGQTKATAPSGGSTRDSSRASVESRQSTLAPQIEYRPAVSPEARPMPKPVKPAALQMPPRQPTPKLAKLNSPPPKIQSMMKSSPSQPQVSKLSVSPSKGRSAEDDAPPVQTPPKPKPQRPPQRMSTETPTEDNKPKPKPLALAPKPRVVSNSTTEVLSPKPTRPAVAKPVLQVVQPSPVQQTPAGSPMTSASRRPPTPPQPRNKTKPPVTSTRYVQSASASPARQDYFGAGGKPKRSDTVSTDDSFVSASSHPSPEDETPPLVSYRRQAFGAGVRSRANSAASAPTSPLRGTPRPYGYATSNSSNTIQGLNNLTSAIMAGSLASSRLTPQHTGSSLPPPLPQRHTKSPRLRETMRKANSHDSEEEESTNRHRGHKHRLSRGKHKHHEGSRKKWRDQITLRERKRYEAVWASNRGNLLPPTLQRLPSGERVPRARDTSDLVVNVIVRDLWRRSRLPEDELSEVWTLVDREGRGFLGRQEFVVGMWLIDQRLKGRKIPQKVSDSVWGSANGVMSTTRRVKH